jgi:hypothetical protein
VFLRGNASVNYDSNIFHIANGLELPAALGGPEQSDIWYGLGAGVRMNLPVSRQQLRLDASATRYWYTRFGQLDYTGYALTGAWDWRAGNDWYGTLSAGISQALTTSSPSIGFYIPSLYKSYNALIDVHNALTPRWDLQASASVALTRYNEEVQQVNNFNTSTYDLAARYTSPAENVTGVRLRFESGVSPNQPPAPVSSFSNNFDQYTLSALLDWHLTGHSRLYGDVGYTVRSQGGNFNGLSGRLTYEYIPTSKTVLSASIYEIRGPINDFQATYVRTVGVAFSATYQLTAKIALRADLGASQVDYLGSTESAALQRKDKLNTVGVGASYQATRTLYFSAGVRSQPRSSNIPLGSYYDNVAYLGGTIEF